MAECTYFDTPFKFEWEPINAEVHYVGTQIWYHGDSVVGPN